MASIDRIITKSGEYRWKVRYDVYENGTRRQKTKTFATSKAAKAYQAEVEHSINTGMYADARGLTLGAYLDIWIDTYTAHNKPNAVRGYRNVINNHLKPRIGGVKLESLTATIIQKAYNDILHTEYQAARYEDRNGAQVLVKPAKTYAPKTLRNINAVLHMVLERARADGLLARNYAEDVKLPTTKKPSREYTIPNQEEIQKILDAARGSQSYHAIAACALLACRRGEALGLYWSDIDFKNNEITLKRALIENNLTNTVEIADLKTDNSYRTIPLPKQMRQLLLDIREQRRIAAQGAGEHVIDSPFVFLTAAGKPFRPSSVSRAYKRAADRVGIDTHLHELRHAGVTHMLTCGIDPKTVSGFVGHASAQFTLNQYAHVMKHAKQRASEALDGLVKLV